jgi:hypothetical protein
LEAVCLKCLRKNPWWRYLRAYDVLAWLHAFQEDPTGGAVAGERWPKRPPLRREDAPREPNL